jgi:dienelactone hydrolase
MRVNRRLLAPLCVTLCALLLGLARPSALRADVPQGERVRFARIPAQGEKPLLLRGWWTPPNVEPGRGRAGAVVLMHGCGGPQVASHRWAQQLSEWGYGALVVDSFGPRRIRRICGEPERMLATQRTGDAYGALMFLQSMRGVDPDRIAAMGWSHGGSSVLWAVDKAWGPRYKAYPWVRFQAAVAFYPGCPAHGEFVTPVLILMGGADKWAPPQPCKRMVKTHQANGEELQMVVYPGATHAFDAVRGTVHILGFVLQYDPSAAADAQDRVRKFLRDNVGR